MLLSSCDTYLRSSEIALEEDLVRACEDFDEDKLEELKKSNQLNFVQQQVNRIGKNLQVSMPVARRATSWCVRRTATSR